MSASKPLNPEQKAIVEAPLGVPLKVVAGAGTGKTETLKSRFVYLVNHHGIAPDRILTVTFTEKAAAEMRQRIEAGLGPGRLRPGKAEALPRPGRSPKGLSPQAKGLDVPQRRPSGRARPGGRAYRARPPQGRARPDRRRTIRLLIRSACAPVRGGRARADAKVSAEDYRWRH